ncbi:hypothetical protein BSKO_11515 [Bryopsis sp. KO-2023]|nr:hypothetical protein BSKO_11515 [Bryopsis sp. KO-2023]
MAVEQTAQAVIPDHEIFPLDCQWQDEEGVLRFWNASLGAWGPEIPLACFVEGEASSKFEFKGHTPRSDVSCQQEFCLFTNLWYNNGKFYFFADSKTMMPSFMATRNVEITTLQMKSPSRFIDAVKWRGVPGNTLFLDYTFYLHPGAIGHWLEILLPLFGVFRKYPTLRPPRQIVMLHLNRSHLFHWVRSMLGLTLGMEKTLPKIMLQEDRSTAYERLRAPLEHFPRNEWVCFYRVLMMRDRLTGGERSFLNQEEARLYREAAYIRYGLEPPVWRRPPKKITYLAKLENRRIINEKEILNLLAEFGEVEKITFSSSSSFEDQLKTVSETGVLVAVHTSGLANSVFLRPGSARNWAWREIDKSFKEHTLKLGDIHHFAWRAKAWNETVFLTQDDTKRFEGWSASDCTTDECVEAHTQVDVAVNLMSFRKLLEEKLPSIFAGASVDAIEASWPSAQ